MATVTTDRRRGINSGAAIKVSCVCATTTNITLSGEQTIDGITTSGTRVFVKDQTDATEIGIYLSSASAWTREPDFDGTYDITEGTLIPVSRGTANSDTWWRVTNTGTVTIGTTALTVSTGLTSVGVATTSAITDEAVDTTCFPIFVTDATGNASLHSGTNLTFNSATGELGVTLLTATGAISGTTVTASGIVSVDDATESTSTITGSIHTDGGLGVVKDAFIGGDLSVAGNPPGTTTQVANHIRVGNMQIIDGSQAAIAFDVGVNVAENVKETIGPTVASDNQWSGMSIIPANAKILICDVNVGSNKADSYAAIAFAAGDVTMFEGISTDVWSMGVVGSTQIFNMARVFIPLSNDTDQNFTVLYGDALSGDIDVVLYYRGFMTD